MNRVEQTVGNQSLGRDLPSCLLQCIAGFLEEQEQLCTACRVCTRWNVVLQHVVPPSTDWELRWDASMTTRNERVLRYGTRGCVKVLVCHYEYRRYLVERSFSGVVLSSFPGLKVLVVYMHKVTESKKHNLLQLLSTSQPDQTFILRLCTGKGTFLAAGNFLEAVAERLGQLDVTCCAQEFFTYVARTCRHLTVLLVRCNCFLHCQMASLLQTRFPGLCKLGLNHFSSRNDVAELPATLGILSLTDGVHDLQMINRLGARLTVLNLILEDSLFPQCELDLAALPVLTELRLVGTPLKLRGTSDVLRRLGLATRGYLVELACKCPRVDELCVSSTTSPFMPLDNFGNFGRLRRLYLSFLTLVGLIHKWQGIWRDTLQELWLEAPVELRFFATLEPWPNLRELVVERAGLNAADRVLLAGCFPNARVRSRQMLRWPHFLGEV
jgi:hypothetical protein